MSNAANGHTVNKKSVVDIVMDTIIADIISGKYPPGTKLPNEYDLIAELNVSRNSLREAIKILTAMGIVEIRHGDGTYVCSQASPSLFDNVVYSIISSNSSNDDLLELRQIVDDMCVRLAIEKITPEEIAQLEGCVAQMADAIKHNDMEKAKELDYQFHSDLIASCKNALFIRIINGLYTIFKGAIGQTLYLENVDSQAAVFHENIINCIKEKNYRDVHKVVADSLISWRQQL